MDKETHLKKKKNKAPHTPLFPFPRKTKVKKFWNNLIQAAISQYGFGDQEKIIVQKFVHDLKGVVEIAKEMKLSQGDVKEVLTKIFPFARKKSKK